MIVKDISFASVEDNILYDENLFECAETGLGDETLRFWEMPSFCIILGRVSKESLDVKKEEAAKDGVNIVRRMSGGGTVLLAIAIGLRGTLAIAGAAYVVAAALGAGRKA